MRPFCVLSLASCSAVIAGFSGSGSDNLTSRPTRFDTANLHAKEMRDINLAPPSSRMLEKRAVQYVNGEMVVLENPEDYKRVAGEMRQREHQAKEEAEERRERCRRMRRTAAKGAVVASVLAAACALPHHLTTNHAAKQPSDIASSAHQRVTDAKHLPRKSPSQDTRYTLGGGADLGHSHVRGNSGVGSLQTVLPTKWGSTVSQSGFPVLEEEMQQRKHGMHEEQSRQ